MVLTRLVGDLGTVCCLGRGLLFLTGLSLAMDSVGLVWRGLRGLADWRRMRNVKEKMKRKTKKSWQIRKSVKWLNKNSSSARVKKQRSNDNQKRIKMELGILKDYNQEKSNFIANIVEDILSKSVSNDESRRDEVEDEVKNKLETSGLSTDFQFQFKQFCHTRS